MSEGCGPRCLRRFVAGALVCTGLVLAPAASAATVTIDFESAPPPLGQAINDDYRQSAFTFWQRSDPGFRPYRRAVGVPTHSGTIASDIGPDHCFPDEVDDSFDCELPQPGTTANVTKTPTAVSLFAGLFADPGGPVNATLTARRQDNTVAATVTKPIGVGITTPMSVTSAAPDIVKWELSDDAGGSELAFDDLSYEIPDNLVPQIALRGPVQTVPVLQGSHTDVPVSVTRLNGSDGPVHFSVSSLPNGVTGTVTPDPLPGTQSDATLHLTAATDATTTFFTNATLTADPQGNASVAAAPATAPFSVRVASSYELRANDTSTLHLPPCAPADRSFRLDRDFSFAATASLSIEGVPPGVTASIVEGTTIAPGGGFNVDRTLRVSRTTQDIPAGSAITIRARAPGFPDKTLSIPIDGAAGSVTIGGPTSAGTARLLHPGTTVTLNGNGFCPGSSVSVGTPSRTPTPPWRPTARA